MKVARWGNSLALRIPKSVASALELKEGDEVTVTVGGPHEIGLHRPQDRAAFLERLKQFRGRLPADFKFDREEANSRE